MILGALAGAIALFLNTQTAPTDQLFGSPEPHLSKELADSGGHLTFKGLAIGMPLADALAIPHPDLADLRTHLDRCRDLPRAARSAGCQRLLQWSREQRRDVFVDCPPAGDALLVCELYPGVVLVGDGLFDRSALHFNCEQDQCPLVEVEISGPISVVGLSTAELLRDRYGALPLSEGDVTIEHRTLGYMGYFEERQFIALYSNRYRDSVRENELTRRRDEIRSHQNF